MQDLSRQMSNDLTTVTSLPPPPDTARSPTPTAALEIQQSNNNLRIATIPTSPTKLDEHLLS